MTAPGRYCLAICYCGQCPHYVPIDRRKPELDPRVWGDQPGKAGDD